MAIFDRMKKRSTDSANAKVANSANEGCDEGMDISNFSGISISNPHNLKTEVSTPSPNNITDEEMERELMEMYNLPTIRWRSRLETGDTWCSELASAIRFHVESLLSGGPVPFSEIKSHTGATDDELRETIRDWPELCAGEIGGGWTWYLKPASPVPPSRPDQGAEHPTIPLIPETGEETAIDPVSLAERIGLRYEGEIPDTLSVRADHPEDTEKVLGKPCYIYRGNVLAWEKDPAHIKVYAWATVNLFPGKPLAVDIDSTARLLELSPREVKDALARLVKDGDLVRTIERGREFYRIMICYGGENEDRD